MIPLALLLALVPQVVELWPPRGGESIVCTEARAWDGGRAERWEPAPDCISPGWRHRMGPGNTFAALSICYRVGGAGVAEWCDYVHGARYVGRPIMVRLVPPGPAAIFADGFEGGGLEGWR